MEIIQIKLLFLIIVANGAPVIGYDIFKEKLSFPLDFGWKFSGGRLLFGPSVTIRGLFLSVMATMVCAKLLSLTFFTGAVISVFAMLGDIFSSFLKRRFAMETGKQALALDQIPESLFPALAVKKTFHLQTTDVFLLVVAFIIIELVISRFLFKLHLRKHPY